MAMTTHTSARSQRRRASPVLTVDLRAHHVVSWTLLSQDFRPIHVKVSSDFAFIYFHSIRLWESADGTRETESWTGFEVWKRTPLLLVIGDRLPEPVDAIVNAANARAASEPGRVRDWW